MFKSIIKYSAPIAAWVLAAPALAQTGPVNVGQDPTNIGTEAVTDFTVDDLVDLIQTLASWVLVIIGLIGVIFLLYGGYKFITAGGDPGKAGEARQMIVYALIGIAVAILAFAIVNFVASIFSSAGITP